MTSCLTLSLEQQKYEEGPPKELLSEETLDFIATELMPAFKSMLEDEELREVISSLSVPKLDILSTGGSVRALASPCEVDGQTLAHKDFHNQRHDDCCRARLQAFRAEHTSCCIQSLARPHGLLCIGPKNLKEYEEDQLVGEAVHN